MTLIPHLFALLANMHIYGDYCKYVQLLSTFPSSGSFLWYVRSWSVCLIYAKTSYMVLCPTYPNYIAIEFNFYISHHMIFLLSILLCDNKYWILSLNHYFTFSQCFPPMLIDWVTRKEIRYTLKLKHYIMLWIYKIYILVLILEFDRIIFSMRNKVYKSEVCR